VGVTNGSTDSGRVQITAERVRDSGGPDILKHGDGVMQRTPRSVADVNDSVEADWAQELSATPDSAISVTLGFQC